MKKMFSCLLALSIILGLTACGDNGSSGNSADISKDNAETTKVVCDVTRYANISSTELIGLLGEPDNISETTPATGFIEIPCIYYDYYDTEELGEVSFLLINDTVVKFTAYNEFPFYKKDKLLESLNVEKSENCAMAVDTEAAIRFWCLTDEIDDLWVTNIDGDAYGFLAVTYDMMYFEEWYLPMSISEESDYQYWTKEYVKSMLKSPKSADFPSIGDWAIVKNNFYVAAQSYVDAVNSFGAEIRSDFTFIYPVGFNTPLYAIFDGEVIVDNGYVPTADVIKQLVEDMAKETPTQSNDQDTTDAPTTPSNEESSETAIPTPTPTIDPAPESIPVPSENTDSVQETNSVSDLEYVIFNVCDQYNSGDTPYSGQLYGTVNGATSVTIEHYVRDLVPASEEYKLYQMEDALVKTFSETLNGVFPESIEIYVYTTATIIDDSDSDSDYESGDLDGISTQLTDEELAELGSGSW